MQPYYRSAGKSKPPAPFGAFSNHEPQSRTLCRSMPLHSCTLGRRTDPIRIVTFSTLFPNAIQPNHGIFVENRLRHLVAECDVVSRVVAPVPWFPVRAAMFGQYADYARIPATEERHGLSILHPRYPLLPKVGMTVAPVLLFLASLPTLRRLAREEDFDLIDAHYFYPDGVAATWLGRVLNKPVVITARGTDVNYIPRYRLPRHQIQAAAASAAALIGVSQALKDALLELGVEPDKTTVLRNGVDLAMFEPSGREGARARLGLTGPTLLSVGHLIERKAHDLVIGALTELPDYRLLIAGDGPERAKLVAQVARLGLGDRVRFLGSVSHSELREIYAACDALVLASSREGWPNVLLEAMACGTPVVASRAWGNPEVVQRPEAGVLMDERTESGVAQGVERLFRELPTRDATRHYAEQFSWEATSKGQHALFQSILQRLPAKRIAA
jgi:teichuronic acid biosynthesis glycosyltransferase TuaC